MEPYLLNPVVPNRLQRPTSVAFHGDVMFVTVGVSEADELEKIGNCAEAKVLDLTGVNSPSLGGGFKHFLFSPLFGEDSHFDEYFFNWVETTN